MTECDFRTLTMLQVDLGHLNPPETVQGYLVQLLAAAQQELERKGVILNSADPADVHLHVMYAAWLYRKRATGAAMPDMLRYALRNAQVHKALTPKEAVE